MKIDAASSAPAIAQQAQMDCSETFEQAAGKSPTLQTKVADDELLPCIDVTQA